VEKELVRRASALLRGIVVGMDYIEDAGLKPGATQFGCYRMG